MSVDQAAELIQDGSTVALGGAGYRMVPEELMGAIGRRFARTGQPRGLRVIALAVMERATIGVGGAGTGLHQLAREGLMTELVCSSLSRGGHELNELVASGACTAATLPMGTILEMLRCTSRGAPGFVTQVGIGTYVDPRHGGGHQSGAADIVRSSIVEIEGHEYIHYPRERIDFALIKGTSIDSRGNLFAENEGYLHSTIYTAMAANNSGGVVIGQAEREVIEGSIHPRFGVVPAPMISHYVVTPRPLSDEHEPSTTGQVRVPMVEANDLGPKDRLADQVLSLIPENACVNVGAGIGMYHLPAASVRAQRDDVYFTIEQGPMGGYPRPGGVARNVDVILDQLPVFDFYEGGGPDVSVLSFAEIDADGRVNVSKFGERIPGGGGLPNIVHGAREVIFCGTFRAGKSVKFVKRVQQVTCDAASLVARGCRVRIVTDVGVFELTSGGLRLLFSAPRIDFESDVLPHIPFGLAEA